MHSYLKMRTVSLALSIHLISHLTVVNTQPTRDGNIVKSEKEPLINIEHMLQVIMSHVSSSYKVHQAQMVELHSRLERIEQSVAQLQVKTDRNLDEAHTVASKLQTISTEQDHRLRQLGQEQLQTIASFHTNLNVSFLEPLQRQISLLNEAFGNASDKLLETARLEQRQLSQQIATLGEGFSQSCTSFWRNSSVSNDDNRQLLQRTVTSASIALNSTITAQMQSMSTTVQSMTNKLHELNGLFRNTTRLGSWASRPTEVLRDICDVVSHRLTECPQGFTYLPGHNSSCYKPVVESLSWDDAALRCRSLHQEAHLIFINSVTEQTAIENFLTSTYHDANCIFPTSREIGMSWWTGGQRMNPTSNTAFVWKAPSKRCIVCGGSFEMTYTKWGPGQPDFAGNSESCMHLYDQGQWNDVPCHFPLCSVCEIEMT